MLFALDRETSSYIVRHGGSVVIDYKFRACFSDGLLTSRRLLGSYVPAVRLGEPGGDFGAYNHTRIGAITIHFPKELKPKTGLPSIQIKRKSLFFYHWLELEGAILTPVFAE